MPLNYIWMKIPAPRSRMPVEVLLVCNTSSLSKDLDANIVISLWKMSSGVLQKQNKNGDGLSELSAEVLKEKAGRYQELRYLHFVWTVKILGWKGWCSALRKFADRCKEKCRCVNTSQGSIIHWRQTSLLYLLPVISSVFTGRGNLIIHLFTFLLQRWDEVTFSSLKWLNNLKTWLF